MKAWLLVLMVVLSSCATLSYEEMMIRDGFNPAGMTNSEKLAYIRDRQAAVSASSGQLMQYGAALQGASKPSYNNSYGGSYQQQQPTCQSYPVFGGAVMTNCY